MEVYLPLHWSGSYWINSAENKFPPRTLQLCLIVVQRIIEFRHAILQKWLLCRWVNIFQFHLHTSLCVWPVRFEMASPFLATCLVIALALNHQTFGKPSPDSKGVVNGSFPPEDLHPMMDAVGVSFFQGSQISKHEYSDIALWSKILNDNILVIQLVPMTLD